MKLKLLSKKVLPAIPSASGIELYNNKLYIIGDDSAWLYILNNKLKLLEKVPLFKRRKPSEDRIPKKIKPDLEAMTFVKAGGESILLIFGSGSILKKRETLFAVFPERNHEVKKCSLANVYREMNDGLANKELLNIEAAAATGTSLFLFNRRTAKRRNMIYEFDIEGFMDHVVFGRRKKAYYKTLRRAALPSIKNIMAGYSGAGTLDNNRMVLSASVEDTKNAIDDGKVLGSFIGIMDIEKGTSEYELIKQGNKVLPVKVESVCVKHSKEKRYVLYAVTDSDGGASELLEIELYC